MKRKRAWHDADPWARIGRQGAKHRAREHPLRDWSERKDPERRAQAIIDRANQAFSSIINARVFVSAPPAIRSLGNATGFDFELQDQRGLGMKPSSRRGIS